MRTKPTTAKGYSPEQSALVRATCLYVATKLGDLLDDVVVVGGLVPSLLIDQAKIVSAEDLHVGTLDLDVGLALAILAHRRYEELTARLRQAGFRQDENDQGQPTRQRWRIEKQGVVTVDFLIPPSRAEERGGTIRDIEGDFAALIAPGLHLAFRDRESTTLSGRTIAGERAERAVWVCGPGAYVVLKALALRLRGENKDAYDLVYVLQRYGSGPGDVVPRLVPLLDDEQAVTAFDFLQEDFAELDSVGPRRYAEFLHGEPDDDAQADARALVLDLVEACRARRPT